MCHIFVPIMGIINSFQIRNSVFCFYTLWSSAGIGTVQEKDCLCSSCWISSPRPFGVGVWTSINDGIFHYVVGNDLFWSSLCELCIGNAYWTRSIQCSRFSHQ